MPLPTGGSLYLQGQPKPTDAIPSRAKTAMIVRMSVETLEALEAYPSNPPMNFEFGENPGVYIGDKFFPMRSLKEASPHEIYLRAPSAAKPMAPLKLYANVTGKFLIERELGDKVSDQVRERTKKAKEQHETRQTILLPDAKTVAPPTATNKKRKAPTGSSLVKRVAQSEHLRAISSSTASASARVASPHPLVIPTNIDLRSTRSRAIHFLAGGPKLAEDVIKAVGGKTSNPAHVRETLEDVAELTAVPKKGPANAPRTWKLKTASWLEVRPYEWHGLSEQGKTMLARQARLAFSDLKIPESDPVWEHVRYRSAGNAPGAPPTASTSRALPAPAPPTKAPKAESKRVAAPKEKNVKAKSEFARLKAADVSVKEESAPHPKVATLKSREGERPSTPDMKKAGGAGESVSKPAHRRLPGSGFKASNVSPQPSSAESSQVSRSGSNESVNQKGAAPIATRPTQKAPSLPSSLPPKPSLSRPQPNQDKKLDTQVTTKQLAKNISEEISRQKPAAASKEDAAAPPRTKRKKPIEDDDDSSPEETPIKDMVQKKRKTEEGAVASSSLLSSAKAKAAPVRDLALPKKPAQSSSPAPRPKIKKEPSPAVAATAVPSHRVSTPQGAAGTGLGAGSSSKHRNLPEKPKTNGSVKVRRKSPIYTSSDEEESSSRPARNDTPPAPAEIRKELPRAPPRGPLPSDRSSLRARYHSSYNDYIGAFQRVIAQRSKIQKLLSGNDSEGDSDLMDIDELTKLSAEHSGLRDELENIRQVWTSGQSTSASASASD